MLRLIFALICFAFALLAILPAPTHFAWELSVVITEWGWSLALIAMLAFLPGWRRTRTGQIAAAIAALAALLALSPLVRAHIVARTLPQRIADSFGATDATLDRPHIGRTSPLSVIDLVGRVRAPAIPVRTLTYARTTSGDLQLDLYAPPHTTPLPLVIVIHGGSWQSGDRTQLSSLNTYLAAHGYAVAAISYSFAPQHAFPAALDDARAALAYLKTNARALGLDTTRVAFIGRSAGGQLALLAAYTAHDPGVRGVVSFYGPTDMKWGYEHPSRKLVMDSKQVLEDYLNSTPETSPITYDNASPVRFVRAGSPPTLMIHGIKDELVSIENSRRLDRALTTAHVPHLLLAFPWATHGCDYNFSGPCGQLSTYAIERFLARVMH